ncbi:MAG: cytochrome c biogenesis protein ResB [Desulfobaccales bacterium]
MPTRLWRTITSLRLTLTLLILLALVSLMGTVRSWIFGSGWFLAPLGLFVLNLTACLIRGLPQAVRRARQGLTPVAALDLPERARFFWPKEGNPPAGVEKALRRELGRVRKNSDDHQTVLYWDRGRHRPLGPYVVHLALLIILVGALVGRFLGVEGRLTLREGETAELFTSAGKDRSLDFQVRLDRFQVLHYPDGTPREFRSDLTFTRPGNSPTQMICRVNEPVTFGGLTFYQSSYGHVLRLEVRDGAQSHLVEALEGQTVELPGSRVRLRVLEYQTDLRMPRGEEVKSLGPAARLALWDGEGHPVIFAVLKNRPELADKQPGPYRFFLQEAAYFSVFQVKRDPGVWWVYAGFLLLLPGLFLAFLNPAERWALVLRRTAAGGWEARLLGAAPRNRESFQQRLKRLKELLEQGGAA